MADGWGFHRDKQWRGRGGHIAGMWFSWGLMRSKEVEATLWAQFRGSVPSALSREKGSILPGSRAHTFLVPPFSSSINRIKSAGLLMTLTCTLF